MMKLQLLDKENNVIDTKEFEYNQFDTVFGKYDWMDGLEVTLLKNGVERKGEYDAKTPQGKAVKGYVETLAQQYVNEYLSKYEQAESDLIKHKENKPEVTIEQNFPNSIDNESIEKFHMRIEKTLEGTGIKYATTQEEK